MDITDLVDKNNIVLNTRTLTKDQVISQMAERLLASGYISNKEEYVKAIYKRENEISTSVGYSVAIPHAQSNSVKKSTIAILRDYEGIDWGEDKVKLVFMIAAPEHASNEHLKMLSKISTFLMNEIFRAKLITASNATEVMNALKDQDAISAVDSSKESAQSDSGKYLIGISACMTGIAHTFMAAEALKGEAKKRGMRVKIQTNGSTGIEDKLTEEDISSADAIVVAHDVKVDTDVFGNRKYLDVPVKEAISDPERIVNEALKDSGEGSKVIDNVEEENTSEPKEVETKAGAFGRAFYTHVMSGVSYMIPFIVVGGIFIAISFMFGINASDVHSSSYNVFAAFMNTAGSSAAFALYIPILGGFISWSIADKPGLAPGMIGGMMASLGGSGFLGGMVAGFMAGYLTRYLVKATRKVPHTYQGLLSVLFIPLIVTFVVAFIMYFVLDTPMSEFIKFLTNWLKSMNGTNAAVMGAILAGMMASDMGGPINKTASAFGLAMFAANIFQPSAALMVGGMVPPLGIAIATTLFRRKFTNQEREAGRANWVLGACFITEGAIPFAAGDPLRVIPANIIGSAIGGALCMAAGITLRAPHGGIFVIPVACSKPILYIGCILLGAFITALILGFTKKTLCAEQMSAKMVGGII
ncbi:PTS fructose transporter subunit IIABC [Pediococcus parvulus]|uniref:PTS fructose transporter subunit IIABC n=1 Tax=Pediococcus parvulus TaxID=54062 RepID=UPI0021A467C6|nr:fructose-specific PTS transporter subunit EIIC [Pediococcus parvulus]MCT3035208.1 PTS fructose transporter subunit IIA [Pediococcus parvulus]